jgi:hypothetical protein
MKKPLRVIPLLILMVLTIPVFRFLCERYSRCEIMRAYAILTDKDFFLESMAY